MRYAITFTSDESWNTVDTLIVETDTNPFDMTKEQLIKMFEAYIIDSDVASEVANNQDYWFCRNLEPSFTG